MAMRRVAERAARLAAKAAGMEGGEWAGPERLKNRDAAMRFAAVAVGMVGVTYASVPLYRIFCQATGLGGTTARVEDVAQEGPTSQRAVRVHLDSARADGLPWRFVPTQRSVEVRPGESALAFYSVENESNEEGTGVAAYNVSPGKAGRHFAKVQCFCFTRERLEPGQHVRMPVQFFISPQMLRDSTTDDVEQMTLSYTFFRANDQDGAKDLDRLDTAQDGGGGGTGDASG